MFHNPEMELHTLCYRYYNEFDSYYNLLIVKTIKHKKQNVKK